MKTYAPELLAYLNDTALTQFKMADLFTITLQTGTVLRYTTADIDVVWSGNTFNSRGPLVKRGMTRVVVGLEVDTLDITVNADSTHLVDGIPFIAAAIQGYLDGATVLLQKAFFTDWAVAPVGAVILFSGRVSDVSGTRTEVQLMVKSDLELLNIKMPRNLYQSSCLHTVYDSGCGVNKVAFTVAGSVTSASANGQSLQSALAQAAGWFDQGVLTFTSGLNTGMRRTVKAYSSGNFSFALPLPYAPQAGDAFTVYPGCDKTQATCVAKFNNLPRNRGFYYVPVPETAT